MRIRLSSVRNGKDEVGTDSGAAYIFVRSGNSWTQQAKLTHQDAVLGDEFGSAVAVYGDNALVGAHLSDAAGPDSGAAYLFTRSGEQLDGRSPTVVERYRGRGRVRLCRGYPWKNRAYRST